MAEARMAVSYSKLYEESPRSKNEGGTLIPRFLSPRKTIA